MKLKCKPQLTSSLQQVIQALDDVDDADHNWRAELKMYALLIMLLLFVPFWPLMSPSGRR